MSLSLSRIIVGPIRTNCYFATDTDTNETLVIDPGDNGSAIIKQLEGTKVIGIALTHTHSDHTGALPELIEATGAPCMAHEADADMAFSVPNPVCASKESVEGHQRAVAAGKTVDRILQDGDIVTVGSYELKVIHTPGHTPGCVCYYCESEKVLFSGDTLFAHGSYGRTDFPGGNMREMINTLSTAFVDIPDDVSVFPGHESPTTMGAERHGYSGMGKNPYLK